MHRDKAWDLPVAALLTGEALQMVDICAGAHNHLKGRDDLKTKIFEEPCINMSTYQHSSWLSQRA